MRLRRRALAAIAAGGLLTSLQSTATAQYGAGSQTTRQVTLTPAGETEVNYFDGGTLTNSTRIPSGSAFNTTGRGSGGGGAPQPCNPDGAPFIWYTEEANSPPIVDPVTGAQTDAATGQPWNPVRQVQTSQLSTAWVFTEITPSGTWSPEAQGQLDQLGTGASLGGHSMTSTVTMGESYRASTTPLASATRRFRVNCGLPAAYANGPNVYGPDGPAVGFRDVGLADPFWNPLVRLGVLWGMVQLPTFRVISPPEVATWGGLVVNMPTWLQIDAAAWRPYFTDVDEYMGWQSQLGLFPADLEFEVVGPDGQTVPCAPAQSAASNGAIPGWPADLPDFYELGQLGRDCTWVPQEKGSVTIRARITYDVLLTISGFSEQLSPYVWYSDPLTLPVGEIRVRNVTPEGGVGG